MGYSNYKTLKQVVTKFNLSTERTCFFENVKLVEPSDWLKQSMKIASAVSLSNEKVKSERLISPILSEIHILHQDKFALYSGEDLNIQPENDLNGPCDFFFSANPKSYLLQAPIIALTEAKDEDMDYGIAQCTAQMIGAQIFNELEGSPYNTIWGCATTGGEWRFLQLNQKTIFVDINTFYIDKLELLLGVFHHVLESIIKSS